MDNELATVMDSLGLKSQVIGNYTLDEVLGRGGMGVVFRARQQHLKRSVALKIIPDSSADKLVRFEEEIKQLSRLSHPNIVQAFDAGQREGLTYLAMELVEGETLESLVRRRVPLKTKDAVKLIKQAAVALSYAHQNGIIHRDVKPANLMLDSTGNVKLLDLGMTRMIRNPDFETDSPTRLDLTSTGMLLGTPEFMAPEQAEDPSCSDQRSDIYALGGTFYFLLTGKRMFESADRIDAILSHQSGDPPHLGSSLDGIFQKMVARNPADRYPSMDSVVRDLDSVEFPRAKFRLATYVTIGLALLCIAIVTIGVFQSRAKNPILADQQQSPGNEKTDETRVEHPHETLETALAGTTWQLTYPSKFVFQKGGVAYPVDNQEEAWTWAAISSSEVVIRYPSGWINVIEFDPTRTTCRLHELGIPSHLGSEKQHRHTGELVN